MQLVFFPDLPSACLQSVEYAKRLLDRFSYSGFHQDYATISITSGASSSSSATSFTTNKASSAGSAAALRKYSDKFRVMMGVRTVADEVDPSSLHLFPAELRRFLTSRKRTAEVMLGVASAASAPVSLSTISSTIRELGTNKRMRLDSLISMLDGSVSSIAGSAARERERERAAAAAAAAAAGGGDGKDGTKKEGDGGTAGAGEDEDDEGGDGDDDDDEEFDYDDDNSDDDDYTARYHDDDEDGANAFGDDDNDEGAF